MRFAAAGGAPAPAGRPPARLNGKGFSGKQEWKRVHHGKGGHPVYFLLPSDSFTVAVPGHEICPRRIFHAADLRERVGAANLICISFHFKAVALQAGYRQPGDGQRSIVRQKQRMCPGAMAARRPPHMQDGPACQLAKRWGLVFAPQQMQQRSQGGSLLAGRPSWSSRTTFRHWSCWRAPSCKRQDGRTRAVSSTRRCLLSHPLSHSVKCTKLNLQSTLQLQCTSPHLMKKSS